jgi:flagellar motor switch protein FliN
MMKTPSPYDWVRHVDPELLQVDATPLLGSAPLFPWEQLSKNLASCFTIEKLSIQPDKLQWRSTKELLEGLGDHPVCLNLAVPSIPGSLAWIMPEEEVNILMSIVLTKESHPLTFQDPELRESFCRFIHLETLYQLSQIDFDKSLAPVLSDRSGVPTQDSLSLDVSISMNDQVLWGRLLISPEFRQGWVEKHAKPERTPLANEIAKQADAILHVELGRSFLTLPQWSSVRPGDFLLLEQCDWNPDTLSGHIGLTSNSIPVFSGLLEEGRIKIIEFSHYYEARTPMNNHASDDDTKENNELSAELENDEDFQLDDEDSFELTIDDESLIFETTPTSENPLSEAGEQDVEQPVEPTPEENPISVEAVEEPETIKTHVAPKDIPVSLIVEVGRIHMTVEKLLELEPGNLLDLNIHPENGVDLIINSKKVGKGELIRIGESLGIRVLEMG